MPPERQTTERGRPPRKSPEPFGPDILLFIVTPVRSQMLPRPRVWRASEETSLLLGFCLRLHVDIHVILVDFRRASIDEDREGREGVLGIVRTKLARRRVVVDLVERSEAVVAHGEGLLSNSG